MSDDVMQEKPESTPEERLTFLVRAFMREHKVSCAESIFQRDVIAENALDLIESLCDVIGYEEKK